MNPDIWTTRAVAIAVFAVLLMLVGVLCFIEVPKANHDIVLALASVVATSSVTIVSFFFGSSSSSRDKDATIKSALVGTNEPTK